MQRDTDTVLACCAACGDGVETTHAQATLGEVYCLRASCVAKRFDLVQPKRTRLAPAAQTVKKQLRPAKMKRKSRVEKAAPPNDRILRHEQKVSGDGMNSTMRALSYLSPEKIIELDRFKRQLEQQ